MNLQPQDSILLSDSTTSAESSTGTLFPLDQSGSESSQSLDSSPAIHTEDTSTEVPLRRLDCIRQLPGYLQDYQLYAALASLYEPSTYREASFDPLWQQAIQEELQALLKAHTWDLVDLPPGKSVIGCKYVYKIKTRANGEIERYKARLVVLGSNQEYDIDYEETFAR